MVSKLYEHFVNLISSYSAFLNWLIIQECFWIFFFRTNLSGLLFQLGSGVGFCSHVTSLPGTDQWLFLFYLMLLHEYYIFALNTTHTKPIFICDVSSFGSIFTCSCMLFVICFCVIFTSDWVQNMFRKL